MIKKMNIPILLPLFYIIPVFSQYTELTNTEGKTIKAIVFDTGDPVKIKTAQGGYYSIPRNKFSAETHDALSRIKIPAFQSFANDLSETPSTLTNPAPRVFIRLQGENVLGFYPDEKKILLNIFKKVFQVYETEFRGTNTDSLVAYSEPKTRILQNPKPDLDWIILKEPSGATLSIPKCYFPINFTTFRKETISAYSKVKFGSPAAKNVDNGIYDTKAKILSSREESSIILDPYAFPSEGYLYAEEVKRISLDIQNIYHLYEYIKHTDFEQVVRSAITSK